MATTPLAQQILETLCNIVRIQRHSGHPANRTPGVTFVPSIIHRREERDRRVVLPRITETGSRLMDESRQNMIEMSQRIVRALGKEDARTLHALLRKVLGSLDELARSHASAVQSQEIVDAHA